MIMKIVKIDSQENVEAQLLLLIKSKDLQLTTKHRQTH